MEDIRMTITQAQAVRIYSDGHSKNFSCESVAFASLLAAWNETTAQARPMPAFGVSIDALTRKERESGWWVEFVFASETICGGLPFQRLLIKIMPEYRGFNLIRYNGDGYTGRCLYLDLGENTMRPLYDAARAAYDAE